MSGVRFSWFCIPIASKDSYDESRAVEDLRRGAGGTAVLLGWYGVTVVVGVPDVRPSEVS